MIYGSWPLLLIAPTILLSAAIVWRMIDMGIMDTPGHRSAHTRPTPKGGGVGVLVALLIFLPVMRVACDLPAFSPSLAAIWLATAGLGAFAWLDDIKQWPAISKLLAQFIAAFVICCGFLVSQPDFGLINAVIAFLWLVFATNAINFMDGLNGLISGTLLTAGALIAMHYSNSNPALLCSGALMAAALSGFLPFNFPKAKIFLGDVGSQGCGIFCAAMALAPAGILHSASMEPWLLVPALLSGLLYDVTFTLIRRARAADSLMEAHRGHLYQLAYRGGIPAAIIACIHWLFALWGYVALQMSAAITHDNFQTAILLVLLIIFPQITWTGLVVRRAQKISDRW